MLSQQFTFPTHPHLSNRKQGTGRQNTFLTQAENRCHGRATLSSPVCWLFSPCLSQQTHPFSQQGVDLSNKHWQSGSSALLQAGHTSIRVQLFKAQFLSPSIQQQCHQCLTSPIVESDSPLSLPFLLPLCRISPCGMTNYTEAGRRFAIDGSRFVANTMTGIVQSRKQTSTSSQG